MLLWMSSPAGRLLAELDLFVPKERSLIDELRAEKG
jgi:hypothetical protein